MSKKKKVRPHHKNAADKKKGSDERTKLIIALITAVITLINTLIKLITDIIDALKD